jgi:hypothetical protein
MGKRKKGVRAICLKQSSRNQLQWGSAIKDKKNENK